jgi:NAD(P)H-hydrate repair Nnr-like enzyme with NAD(P)H-hydrate epimerase domain
VPLGRKIYSAGLGSALAALALAAFFGAGCGGTEIDASKTQDLVKANVEHTQHVKVSSVDCPSGVEVDPGKTFSCTVHFSSGKTSTATLEIRDKDANMAFLNLSAAK